MLILCYRTFSSVFIPKESDTSLTKDFSSCAPSFSTTPEHSPALAFGTWQTFTTDISTAKKRRGNLIFFTSLPSCKCNLLLSFLSYFCSKYDTAIQWLHIEIILFWWLHDIFVLSTAPFSAWSCRWSQWGHQGFWSLITWELKGKNKAIWDDLRPW